MRTAVSKLEWLEPRSLAEALEILGRRRAVPVAGCTDVYVGLNAGALKAATYLNLWGLKELRGIRERGGLLSIGALTTYTELIRSPLVNRRLPILAAAAREVGGVQIQNRGTVGGNVANASPAGDSLPVLAAADATIVLRSVDAERRVPLRAFYTGYRRSVMTPDELIVAIEAPRVRGRQWFRKVGPRAAQAISKVVVAGVRGRRIALGLGSVAPTVVWVEADGSTTLEGLQRAVRAAIRPIDDIRSTAEYRRRVTANLVARFWEETG